MTRWGLYGEPELPPLSVFAEGLAGLGLSYCWRNHNHWSGETEQFDAVAIYGMRAQGRDIVEHYMARGIPVVVLDHGYLKRVQTRADYNHGHFQVGVGRLGWVPKRAPSGDRLAALGVTAKARPARPIRRAVIFGQVPFDAQHRLTASELQAVYEALAAQLRRAGAKRVTFRPHPLGMEVRPDTEHDGVWTLAESIAAADVVVALNSNAGLDALIEGCPAITLRESHYGAIAYRWPVRLGAVEAPSPELVTAHLERIAYAQWTADEIREGRPHRFLQSIGAIP